MLPIIFLKMWASLRFLVNKICHGIVEFFITVLWYMEGRYRLVDNTSLLIFPIQRCMNDYTGILPGSSQYSHVQVYEKWLLELILGINS